MTINFHPNFPGKRYIVNTVMSTGDMLNVYAGNNYASAVKTANFWDERMDTYMFDMANETYDGYGYIQTPHYTGVNVSEDVAKANDYLNTVIAQSFERALAKI